MINVSVLEFPNSTWDPSRSLSAPNGHLKTKQNDERREDRNLVEQKQDSIKKGFNNLVLLFQEMGYMKVHVDSLDLKKQSMHHNLRLSVILKA
uniref:TMV resistance protein N-like n=1 Tax=Caenorhabditis tropicalis TaxID=1561998 RepID=A0A1I7TR21_9PELO